MSKLFSFFLAADASLQVLMYSVFHVILLQKQCCCDLILGLMVHIFIFINVFYRSQAIPSVWLSATHLLIGSEPKIHNLIG